MGVSRVGGIVGLLDRGLALALQIAPESRSLGTRRFRKEISACRARMVQAPDPGQLEPIARDAVDLCERFFGRSKRYLAEREQEFQELIQMLHDAVAAAAGVSSRFHHTLLASGDALNRLAELDDIRMLKTRLGEEVSELRRTVELRQREEQAHYQGLLTHVGELETKLERTRKEALVDALTGISNRGSFDRSLNDWVERHQAEQVRFVLAMVDVDDFKRINDEHGHQVGDRVLKSVAQTIAESIRESDMVARYGGEEFVVLLGNTRLKGAREHMSEIIQRIAGNRYTYQHLGEQRFVSFTVSVGMSEYLLGEGGHELLRRADEAVYAAKSRGKNCVVVKKGGLLSRLGA